MPTWLDIAAVLVLLGSASLTVGIALGRSAKRADERVDQPSDVAKIAGTLKPLSAERSPSGTRFFPTLHARRELAEMVHEVLDET